MFRDEPAVRLLQLGVTAAVPPCRYPFPHHNAR